MAEVPNQGWNKWQHCSKEHCSSQIVWVEENQTAADIRPVGIADDDHLLPTETVSLSSIIDELCQFFCASLEILHIKNSLCKTTKESWHPVLQNLASHS